MYSSCLIRERLDEVQETLYNVKKGKIAIHYVINMQIETLTKLKDIIQENIHEYRSKKKNLKGKFLRKYRTQVIDNKIYLHQAYLNEIARMKTEFELYMPKTP